MKRRLFSHMLNFVILLSFFLPMIEPVNIFHASSHKKPSSNLVNAQVDSRLPWQSSGVFVQANEIISLQVVDGQWTDWIGGVPYNNGIGWDYICTDYFPYDECVEPMPDERKGSLIGKIGNDLFAIGSGTSYTAQLGGELYLRINDDDNGLWDNDGILTVKIYSSVNVTQSPAYLPLILSNYGELPPIILETTEVLTDQTTSQISSISEDGSIFTFSAMTSELESVDIGDVIVGDTSAAAPNGFLRKVTNISSPGGQVVVNTVPTSLEDTIQQGTISFSKQLTPADIESITAKQGVTLLNIAGPMVDDRLHFEIKDVVLYDNDGNYNTTEDQIKANGEFELAPDIDFDVTYRNRMLQNWQFVLNVEETTKLDFNIEVEALSLELVYEIARLRLGTVTVFVGLVPVVFVIEMPIYLQAEGDVSVGITTSVTQQANLSAGLRYEQGDRSPISSLTNDFIWKPPTPSVKADFKGYINPPISLLLYGVAGPFAAANPFMELKVDIYSVPWWELYGGIEATVGVKAEVLGHSLGDHTEVVIGYRILLAQATSVGTETPTHTPTLTRTPTPTGTATPTSTPTLIKTATKTPTPTATPTTPVIVQVDSRLPWQSSGVFVQANEIISLQVVDGQWTDWIGVVPYNNGTGWDYICTDYLPYDDCVEPMPDERKGSLIGKIVNDFFAIGNGTSYTAQLGGELYLRINDDDNGLWDNDGILTVRIVINE